MEIRSQQARRQIVQVAQYGFLALLFVGVLAILDARAQTAPVTEKDAADSPVAAKDFAELLQGLIGQQVSLELRNDKVYSDAKLLRVITDSVTDQPKKLRFQLEEGGSRTWSLAAVRSISQAGKLVYQKKINGERKSKHKKRLSRREQAAQRAAEEKRQWLARLEARGLKPWPRLTEQQHREAIEKHKERYKKVAALLPSLRLIETEHFLFCTNIPHQQVGGYIASLDRMYAWMQETYGLGKDEKVWRGKASVFAFVREAEFAAFERQFMKNQPKSSTAGLCHYDSRRNVCIAVHQGKDADYFGVVLVHETSHGFIHCYKTPVRVPSWVNEGMAEVIASLMVPKSKGIALKEKSFLKALKSVPQPRLGEEFFAVDKNIPFNRYGGASSMTRFLLQSDPRSYVRFINLLKEGMPWEEALGKSYNASKEQLVASYGRWLGVPQLRP